MYRIENIIRGSTRDILDFMTPLTFALSHLTFDEWHNHITSYIP